MKLVKEWKNKISHKEIEARFSHLVQQEKYLHRLDFTTYHAFIYKE